jgi:hypothetical protein
MEKMSRYHPHDWRDEEARLTPRRREPIVVGWIRGTLQFAAEPVTPFSRREITDRRGHGGER